MATLEERIKALQGKDKPAGTLIGKEFGQEDLNARIARLAGGAQAAPGVPTIDPTVDINARIEALTGVPGGVREPGRYPGLSSLGRARAKQLLILDRFNQEKLAQDDPSFMDRLFGTLGSVNFALAGILDEIVNDPDGDPILTDIFLDATSRAGKELAAVGAFLPFGVGTAALGVGEQADFGAVFKEAGLFEGITLSDAIPFAFSEDGKGLQLKEGAFFDFTAAGTLGLAADIFTDPLTYLGGVGLVRKGISITLRHKGSELGVKYLTRTGEKFFRRKNMEVLGLSDDGKFLDLTRKGVDDKVRAAVHERFGDDINRIDLTNKENVKLLHRAKSFADEVFDEVEEKLVSSVKSAAKAEKSIYEVATETTEEIMTGMKRFEGKPLFARRTPPRALIEKVQSLGERAVAALEASPDNVTYRLAASVADGVSKSARAITAPFKAVAGTGQFAKQLDQIDELHNSETVDWVLRWEEEIRDVFAPKVKGTRVPMTQASRAKVSRAFYREIPQDSLNEAEQKALGWMQAKVRGIRATEQVDEHLLRTGRYARAENFSRENLNAIASKDPDVLVPIFFEGTPDVVREKLDVIFRDMMDNRQSYGMSDGRFAEITAFVTSREVAGIPINLNPAVIAAVTPSSLRRMSRGKLNPVLDPVEIMRRTGTEHIEGVQKLRLNRKIATTFNLRDLKIDPTKTFRNLNEPLPKLTDYQADQVQRRLKTFRKRLGEFSREKREAAGLMGDEIRQINKLLKDSPKGKVSPEMRQHLAHELIKDNPSVDRVMKVFDVFTEFPEALPRFRSIAARRDVTLRQRMNFPTPGGEKISIELPIEVARHMEQTSSKMFKSKNFQQASKMWEPVINTFKGLVTVASLPPTVVGAGLGGAVGAFGAEDDERLAGFLTGAAIGAGAGAALRIPFTKKGLLPLLSRKAFGEELLSLPLYPSFFTRNFYSNTFLTFEAAGAGSFNARTHGKIFKTLFGKGSDDDIIELGLHRITRGDLRRDMKRFGVETDERALAELTGDVSPFSDSFGEKLATHPVAKIRNWFKGQTLEGRKLNSLIENYGRASVYMTQLSRGATRAEASRAVNRFLFNYSRSSLTEREVIKKIVPFYRFTRSNLELQLAVMIDDPGKLAFLSKFLRDQEGDFEIMPTWERDETQIRLNEDMHTIFTLRGVDLPPNQLELLDSVAGLLPGRGAGVAKGQVTRLLSMIHPILKGAFIELPTNQDLFTGRTMDRETNNFLGEFIIEPLGEPFKEWVNHRVEETAGGRRIHSFNGHKFYMIIDSWGFSRILGTPDSLWRQYTKDGDFRNFAMKRQSGLTLGEIPKDKLAKKRYNERLNELREAAKPTGIANEFGGVSKRTRLERMRHERATNR